MEYKTTYPLNPYSEIRTEPLITEESGIRINKQSVMNMQPNKDTGIEEWKGVGTVSNNYLLINNSEVKDVANEIAEGTDLDWTEGTKFWDGKRYMYTLKTTESVGEVAVGDDVALGLQFWNSYDGSTSFSMRYMLYRLACLNGMTFNHEFQSYRFKHTPKSENWEEIINGHHNRIKGALAGDVKNVIAKMRNLTDVEIDTVKLRKLRIMMPTIPVNTWGNIMDRFLLEEPKKTGWDMLNAATNVTWHKEKQNKATLDQNAVLTETIMEAFGYPEAYA